MAVVMRKVSLYAVPSASAPSAWLNGGLSSVWRLSVPYRLRVNMDRDPKETT